MNKSPTNWHKESKMHMMSGQPLEQRNEKKLKSFDAIKIITARKNILNKLDRVYPSGLFLKDIMQMNSIIAPFYDWDLFKKDIAYLKEKGYITFVDNDPNLIQSTEQKIVKLTATGKEIAEGTMIDEALEISFTSNNLEKG